MEVDVVRWPGDIAADHGRVAVVTVNYNTAPLIALLLWSLYQVLDTGLLELVVVVDNGSTDGSAELLSGLNETGLCHLVANTENRSHGPGINQGISYLAQRAHETGRGPAWVWVLDSDCVVARPDTLEAATRRTCAGPAVIGESQPDPWHGTDRFGTHCLLIDPARTWREPIATFDASGDPSFAFLASCKDSGLPLAEFKFLRDGYVIHRGRGTLAQLVRTQELSNPLYAWAVDHHEAHFGGIEGAAERYALLTARFRAAVPTLDASSLIKACADQRSR